jgi:hypothetical protein
MSKFKTKLDYVSGAKILPDGAFGISPSNISKFFDKPHEWYREQVLGEEGFTGSTASVLGTCVHFCAEEYAKTGKVDVDSIYKYIYKETCSGASEVMFEQAVATVPVEDVDTRYEMWSDLIISNQDNENIDAAVILEQWKPMGQALITLLYTTGVPQRSEELVKAQVTMGKLPEQIQDPDEEDTYWVSGSCDAVLNAGETKYFKWIE